MACEHDTVWAWQLRNASNIVMVGTPQTESTGELLLILHRILFAVVVFVC